MATDRKIEGSKSKKALIRVPLYHAALDSVLPGIA